MAKALAAKVLVAMEVVAKAARAPQVPEAQVANPAVAARRAGSGTMDAV